MKYARLLFLSLLPIVSSCVSITDIAPAGKDTFIIAGSDGMGGVAGVSIKTELYKKANFYCEKNGKKFIPVNDSSRSHNAELTFRCLYDDDPDLIRPNMQPIPTVRIENQ